MSALVEAINLTKIYDGKCLAINNMQVTLEKGKIIGLLGPNGSGKTTFIKLLNGLIQPSSGKLLFNGKEIGVDSKAHIAYLPEKNYLDVNQTVLDYLNYFADFYKDFDLSKAHDLLGRLGIQPESRIKSLSKGTQEKVQLILVMSRNADLYILDEPIAGVDPAARDYILKTIISSYNPDATILMSTHLIAEIENILDEVIFIRYGQVVLQSDVDSIRESTHKSIDAYFREVFAC